MFPPTPQSSNQINPMVTSNQMIATYRKLAGNEIHDSRFPVYVASQVLVFTEI
jgi:hypothetical protein